ncbi:unnamed protein product [Pedinophyceae sp. YPF-701]|nr:unnamed protein product [Pedinophyceae sp. YPF-701]
MFGAILTREFRRQKNRQREEAGRVAQPAPRRRPAKRPARVHATANPEMEQVAKTASHGRASQPSAFRVCAVEPALAQRIADRYDLWPSDAAHSIVYHPCYNIGFFGVENFHPFDSKKYQKVVAYLGKRGVLPTTWTGGLPGGVAIAPREATEAELLDLHEKAYLDALRHSKKVAQVCALDLLGFLPSFILVPRLVRPMRTMVHGTTLALAVAATRGACLHLGGGMHHACAEDGDGWCMFDDWYLALRRLRVASGGAVRRALFIDTDAHQGNGLERDIMTFGDADVEVLDVFNEEIYPLDYDARQAIHVPVPLRCNTKDKAYLSKLAKALESTLGQQAQKQYDVVMYNAGTDVLDGDPLGVLKVSPEGVVRRDEMVFRAALDAKVPIALCTSGGYASNSWHVIAQSFENLHNKFGLLTPPRQGGG